MTPLKLGKSLGALERGTWPYVLVEGPAGTGKSRGILTLMVLRALRYQGARILLTRQTRASMTESILVTLEEEVLPSLGIPVPAGAGRANRMVYDLPGGSSLVCIGQDKPEKIYSTAWDWVYFAEAIEATKDACLKLARGLRHGRGPFHQVVLDTNPGAPGHWLHQIAQPIDPRLREVRTDADYDRLQAFNRSDPPPGCWKRIVTKHRDNPGYWDADAGTWTTAGQRYLQILDTLSGHVRQRLLDGVWCAADGLVYAEFTEVRHVVQPFVIPPEWPHVVGIDPGYDHPTAVLWFALAPNGTMFIVDEIYQGGRSVQQHAAEIHARNAGRTVIRYYGDPQYCWSRTAFSPRPIAAQYADCGISLVPWPRTGTNEVAMVEAVRRRLMGDRIKVFATCQNTIREFQSWAYKRTVTGDLPAGEDRFEDANNDAMDVVKGVVAANPSPNPGVIRDSAAEPDDE